MYYQYFSGEKIFANGAPCEASELVHFRNRIGEEGIELIFKESIRINGKDGQEPESITDTSVKEKNITYPTDNKLHRKIIKKCIGIAQKEGIELRQSYTRILKRLSLEQRFRNHPKNKPMARKADKKVKTIAGRLVRELERKLAPYQYPGLLALFKRVLAQNRDDSNKIYGESHADGHSIHEPHVQCISKGKDHKKYEFGSKVSVMTTKNTGVIIGAINLEKNIHAGIVLRNNFVDRGYRGVKEVSGTPIIIPDNSSRSRTAYQKQKLRKGFKRRVAIEPRIGHLKQDHRLSRNFYAGIRGDIINVMLAAAVMNFKRMINKWKHNPLSFLFQFLHIIDQLMSNLYYILISPISPKLSF